MFPSLWDTLIDMGTITVGSICSGIEAASVAWADLGFDFKWFSETASFPSRLLAERYPETTNVGDMCNIPQKILSAELYAPDLICGGTPCQAFSLAGWKRGLEDHRGNLTLKFVDIINANDAVREKVGKKPSLVFWENVEGVLKDKTNAFGCFVSSLAGFDSEISVARWPAAGVIYGPRRNVAWRVLDAKYFGLPQQRKRLYLIAGGKAFFPENILFDDAGSMPAKAYDQGKLEFMKNGCAIEVFRAYTDCLYSAYGTKWNGNAAAYNGSLFVVQNGRLRRFSPLECERLMGFPDGYTNLSGVKPTARYQAVGNSWAVPVVRWLGKRIAECHAGKRIFENSELFSLARQIALPGEGVALDLANGPISTQGGRHINSSDRPANISCGDLSKIIDVNVDEAFYITPAGCKGILRRREERSLSINPRLAAVLQRISSQWSAEIIEQISRVQTRGRFSPQTPVTSCADKSEKPQFELSLG